MLFHGNPTWSFLWRKVIAELPDLRCVAPDLLGFGLSSRLSHVGDHSLQGHIDAMVELIEALDLRRFVIVGQDWGGPIGIGVGARLPERVAGVVLANTSVLVPRRPRGTAFHRFARLPVLSDLVFRGLGFPQNVLFAVQGDRRSIRGDVAAAYRWPLRRLRDRAGPLGLARMVPNSDQHPSIGTMLIGQEWIQSYAGPMALVWGTSDPILGRALKRQRKAFPRAPVTVTDAGHFLQEEVPRALGTAVHDVATRAAGPRGAVASS